MLPMFDEAVLFMSIDISLNWKYRKKTVNWYLYHDNSIYFYNVPFILYDKHFFIDNDSSCRILLIYL